MDKPPTDQQPPRQPQAVHAEPRVTRSSAQNPIGLYCAASYAFRSGTSTMLGQVRKDARNESQCRCSQRLRDQRGAGNAEAQMTVRTPSKLDSPVMCRKTRARATIARRWSSHSTKAPREKGNCKATETNHIGRSPRQEAGTEVPTKANQLGRPPAAGSSGNVTTQANHVGRPPRPQPELATHQYHQRPIMGGRWAWEPPRCYASSPTQRGCSRPPICRPQSLGSHHHE